MNTSDEIHTTDSSQSQIVSVLDTNHNFLVQKCAFCDKEMELVEGTIIFGDLWYHNSCWKSFNGSREIS